MPNYQYFLIISLGLQGLFSIKNRAAEAVEEDEENEDEEADLGPQPPFASGWARIQEAFEDRQIRDELMIEFAPGRRPALDMGAVQPLPQVEGAEMAMGDALALVQFGQYQQPPARHAVGGDQVGKSTNACCKVVLMLTKLNSTKEIPVQNRPHRSLKSRGTQDQLFVRNSCLYVNVN